MKHDWLKAISKFFSALWLRRLEPKAAPVAEANEVAW